MSFTEKLTKGALMIPISDIAPFAYPSPANLQEVHNFIRSSQRITRRGKLERPHNTGDIYLEEAKSNANHIIRRLSRLSRIDQSHKSHNVPAPYPTMHQMWHFCSGWCIVGFVRLVYENQWALSAKSEANMYVWYIWQKINLNALWIWKI